MEPRPVPEWIVTILVYVASIAILMALFTTMELWPMFRVLGG